MSQQVVHNLWKGHNDDKGHVPSSGSLALDSG